MQTFRFPDVEIRHYQKHGVAHAIIDKMIPIHLGGCYLNLKPLLEIEQPRFCWVKETPNAPQVVIASSKAKKIPEFAITLDNRLESIVVRYWHKHIEKDYMGIKLESIYRRE